MASGFIPCITLVHEGKQLPIDLNWASGEVGYRFEPPSGLEDALVDPNTKVLVSLSKITDHGMVGMTSPAATKMAIKTVQAVLNGHDVSSLKVLRDWLQPDVLEIQAKIFGWS